MIRNFTVLFFLLLIGGTALGQALTVSPDFPSPDQPITITLDLKEVEDGRAEALLGLDTKGELFLWSGVGSDSDPFQFQPIGQNDFNAAMPEKFEWTPLGNSVWTITINDIYDYYSVPVGTPLEAMGLLAKNAAGNAQTEDFRIEFATGFTLRVDQPSKRNIFLNVGESIDIQAVTNKTADLEALFNGNVIGSTNGTSLSLSYTPAESGILRITALNETSQYLQEDFNIIISTPTTSLPLPAGAIKGINYNPADDTEVTLVLEAPNKSSVYVVGSFNDWSISPDYQMFRDGDLFWITIDNLSSNQEYSFYYLVDETIRVADPYSAKVLDPNNDEFIPREVYPGYQPYPSEAPSDGDDRLTVIQTGQAEYNWEITDFNAPAQEDLVIYELLIRDFFGEEFGDGSQSYANLIDTLGYLERLGVNAIELMPIMEFNGNNSWGYNPTFMFAVDKFYGPEEDLKRFIDEAHKRGIAVILDMVLNQNDYPSPLVKMYWTGSQPSTESPWFNQTATHPFNVFLDFNHESTYTQDFVDSVNRYWLEEFHFDGFRFDLSKGFTQTDYGNDVNAWGQKDEGRIAILKRMADEIWSYDPEAYVILEHFADNAEERELANYGMMLWGNMHWDYKDALLGTNKNFNWMYAKDRGWNDNHLVGYIESHDEERVMYELLNYGGSEGDYDVKDLNTALNRMKLGAAFHLLVPGPKMIWEFGEMGYDTSIQLCPDGSLSSNCRVDRKDPEWNYLNDPERKKLFEVYRSILDLKTMNDIVANGEFTWSPELETKYMSYTGTEGTLIVVGNFALTEETIRVPFPATGTYYDYFTDGTLDITSTGYTFTLAPGEFHIISDQDLTPTADDLVPFTLGEVTGIRGKDATSAGINAFPNPAEGLLNVEWPASERVSHIVITDMLGRPVASLQAGTGNRLQIRTEQLPAGAYLIEYHTNKTVYTDRILKK